MVSSHPFRFKRLPSPDSSFSFLGTSRRRQLIPRSDKSDTAPSQVFSRYLLLVSTFMPGKYGSFAISSSIDFLLQDDFLLLKHFNKKWIIGHFTSKCQYWMIQISKLTSSALSLLCFTQVTSGPGHAENIAGFQHESEREREWGECRWQCCGNGTFATANQPTAPTRCGAAMD